MTDESTKNQDSPPDEHPDEKPVDENNILAEVDSILLEEDPDFLNQIQQIKIESSDLDLSIMDQALRLEEKNVFSTFNHFYKPFELKSNAKAVLLFWLIFAVSAVALKFAWDNNRNLLHQNLFLNSLESLGTDLKVFNPNTDLEPFYDNPRFAKNLITISPMHVNLKPSENSGTNPMLAIEVTVEGLSTDAIIEVKDREAEFKDMLSRLTEQRTYDELVVAEGKQNLCEQYRDLLNAHLTRGQVRKVLLKSFVIKP